MNSIQPRPAASPPPIIPRVVLVLLAACFIVAFATIIALGCHAHPAKDDYLSAVMFRNLSVSDALREQYRHHNGRLLSALIMRFSPLQYGSFGGYKIVCIGFAVVFAGGLFLSVSRMLKGHLHLLDRAGLFFAAYLCLHGAIGNPAEFYYWLPAISCYGAASLIFLALLDLLPKALFKGSKNRGGYVALAALAGFAITLCAEPGAIMGLAAVSLSGLHAARRQRLSGPAFAGLLLVITAGFVAAGLSPGNALRMATSPHSRSISQTITGGAYMMSADLLRMLYYLIPAGVFAACVFRALPIRYVIDGKKLLLPVLILGLFGALGEVIAFYGIGGLAALRVRNSFIVLGACLLATTVFMSATVSVRAAAPTPQRMMLSLCGAWIMLGVFIPGNPVCSGMQDLLTGTAGRYDSDMKQVYAEASRPPAGKRILKVSPVREIPASLFVAQPLILKEELNGWPWFNVMMANYFGYERLFADSLARVPEPDAQFQHWLRNKRTQVF